MADCTHVSTVPGAAPIDQGCTDCIPIGGRWVHLRRCVACGHIGCCDSSPNRHATAHHRTTSHPLVQSFEPSENWYWCYTDDAYFEISGETDSPSHP